MSAPQTLDPPRLHHPHSPSKLGRLEDCPGSLAMEEECRTKGMLIQDTEYAEDGTNLHAATLTTKPIPATLPDEQAEVVRYAREYLAAKLAGASEVLYEFPVTLYDAEGQEVTSGTLDAAARYETEARVGELKFGWSPLDLGSLRWQVRCYGAALMQLWGLRRLQAWVVQPRTREEFHGVITDDPVLIAEEVKALIARVQAQRDVRRPSPNACRYCGGKALCPEFKAQVIEPSLALAEREKTEVLANPAEVARILEFKEMLTPFFKAAGAEAHKLLEAGVDVPGWELGTRNPRSISDVQAAFGAVQKVLTQDEFLGACDVSVTRLEKAFAEKSAATGTVKSKAAGERLFAGVTKLVVSTAPQSYLKRKKV